MAEFMKEIGKIMICMVKDSIGGLMEELIKVLIKMIKNMDMECIRTQMVAVTKECGKMVSNMVREYSSHLMVDKEEVNGKKESV
jgi:DNA-binding FrmR family transcriptional regulator